MVELGGKVTMMRRERGFTIIEIMIVVVIIGILAAIAIPIFSGQMKKSKQSEAALQLNMLGKNAKVYYQTKSAFPQGSAGVLPGADGTACSGPNRHFAVTAAWAADPIWQELDFHIDEPNYFSYHYDSSAPGSASALAVGDLDCDGTFATYTLTFAMPGGQPSGTLLPPTNED